MELLGTAALALVLILAVVVIINVAASKKKKPAIEEKKPPVVISVRNQAALETEEAGPEKITIYAFTPAARVKVCAFCDGENDISATYCRICGKQTDG
ncbi:MAG: hypothetical protein IJX69_05090 [Oscillospiraceae bacterium]|nr:hypothetical protein [Oscillospiraceae bacterium]